MEEFLHFLRGEMIKPGVISWFHLIALIPIIFSAIFVPYKFKNCSEKVYKNILLFTWITLLILEAIKQLIKPFHYGNPSYWEYDYRDFPFALCSMIYYFVPIIVFMNKEKHPKIVDAAIGYMCLVSFMAGLIVCFYSDMATTTLIYINVQTFIHHGAQLVMGIFIYVWNRKSVTIKTYYRSMIAFLVTVTIAISLNLLFYPHPFYMFFINPMRITRLPIGNIVQEKAGYAVFLICYLHAVALLAFIAYIVETSIYKLVKRKKSQNHIDSSFLSN